MKVCVVTHDAPHDFGGASTWLQTLPIWKAAGIEIEAHVMAHGGKPGANCAYLKEHGIPIRLMPFLTHVPYAVRSLLQLIKEGQPDIYIPNCLVPAFYAAGYARRAGITTVGIHHTDDGYFAAIADEFINGDPNFRLSAVVPVSSFLESQISSVAAAAGVMVRRISVGVSIPTSVAEPSGSVFRLVYIGRLIEVQKRISEVADALCAVTQSIPNLEAWIVGDGPARGTVEHIIREKGMDARVRLLGRVDNARIYDVLAQCQSLVLLSDYEGLPVAMLEAMASGVVPICLDMRSGVREAIEHGVNGLIVRDRAADFFTAVKSLQSDPANWQRLSLAARQTVQQCYSIEDCARQWIDLLEHLNSRRSPRADFPAFGMPRLPPTNPRFEIFGVELPWRKRVEEYVKSIPPMYRVAKAAVGAGRKIRSEWTGLSQKYQVDPRNSRKSRPNSQSP